MVVFRTPHWLWWETQARGKVLFREALTNKGAARGTVDKFRWIDLFSGPFRGTVTGPEERRLPTKTQKKRSARNKNKTRFRPGTRGECEAQLWNFTGPPGILHDDKDSQVHWVAAESLDAALLYLRKRHDDFMITEARFLGMIPLLSGSPLD